MPEPVEQVDDLAKLPRYRDYAHADALVPYDGLAMLFRVVIGICLSGLIVFLTRAATELADEFVPTVLRRYFPDFSWGAWRGLLQCAMVIPVYLLITMPSGSTRQFVLAGG